MHSRATAAILGGALLVLLFRHPIELALLAPPGRAAAGPSAEPTQVAEEKAPFDALRGRQALPHDRRGFAGTKSARVVGAEPYRFGAAGTLLPVDLALAWGPVLRPPFSGKISYSQFSRFFFWRTKDGSLDRGTIVSHTANTHVIPATARLRCAIRLRLQGRRRAPRGLARGRRGHRRSELSLGHQHDPRGRRAPAPARRSTSTRLTVNERVYE